MEETAGVAQLEERGLGKTEVSGSIPDTSSAVARPVRLDGL